MMDYEAFNQFCSTLTATTHSVQWGGAQVWKVGGKVFAIGGWSKVGADDKSQDKKPAFTFKTSDLDYQLLADTPGFRPAPYLASRGMKWIQQLDVDTEDARDQLIHYLTESHRIVASGLSKKKQRELGLLPDS